MGDLEEERKKFKLACLLEKSLNPVEEMKVSIVPDGFFGFPAEWEKFDEANPFFNYKIELWGCKVDNGKVKTRQMTEEEKEALKDKKGKKPDKKGEEVAGAQNNVDELEGLTEEEILARKYEEFEDPFKYGSIQWAAEDQVLSDQVDEQNQTINSIKDDAAKKSQNKSNTGNEGSQHDSDAAKKAGGEPFVFVKNQDDTAKIEDDVDASGAWLYFYKYPNLPEEEIIKQKKKAKGTGANDYNVLVCKGWVDLAMLQTPGSLACELRVKLEQVLTGDAAEDANPCSFEDSYIKVKIVTEIPIIPIVGDLNPTVNRIVPEKINAPEQVSSARHAVEKLKKDLKVSQKSLAEEYSKQFNINPELSYTEQLKKMHIFTDQQKVNMRAKRKTEFIDKFMDSDKYDLLRSKIEKSILSLVHDTFEKQLPIFPNQVGLADELLSEINIYVGQELETTLSNLIEEQAGTIHKDIEEGHKYYEEQRDNFKNEYFTASPVDKLIEIADEYESLNLKYLADKKFKDVLLLDSQQPAIWYQFCLFNLRMLNYVRAEEALTNALQYDPDNIEYLTLKVCFFIHRGRLDEAKDILDKILEQNKFSIEHNNFLSFMYYTVLERPKLGRKYFAVSQRVKLKQQGLLPNKNDKKFLLNQEKMPQLSDEQNDDLWLESIRYFTKNCFHELAYMAMDLVTDKENNTQIMISATLEAKKLNFDQSNEYLDQLNKADPNDGNVIMKKAENAYMCEKYYEAEELFFRALRSNKKLADFTTLLRLGFVYLNRKSKQDAKNVFTKACEKRGKSTMAWLGQGISCLMLDEFQEAEEALKMANIFDPINSEVWGFTTLFSLIEKDKLPQATPNLQKFLRLEIENLDLIREIGDNFAKNGKNDEALLCYTRILESYDKFYELPINKSIELGNVYLNKGTILHMLRKFDEARWYYERAHELANGENMREQIEQLILSLEAPDSQNQSEENVAPSSHQG